jgi:dihydroorotate dehydrogenase
MLHTNAQEVEKIGAGGLSGKPVKSRSTEVIRYLYQKSSGSFPIIGVGGIFTAEDAKEKLDAGASLVQVYTGFIYEGPSIAKNINKGLTQL